MLNPGDNVTYWWIAENCLCLDNGHKHCDDNEHDCTNHHPMTGKHLEISECGHHRTITGYPAQVVEVVNDPEFPGIVAVLDVNFPDEITTGKGFQVQGRHVCHALLTRQTHCPLASGRRPESGEFTVGDVTTELSRHEARNRSYTP